MNTSPEAKPDDRCVKEYLAGRVSSFNELYERYKNPLYGYLCRSVADRDKADELFQDVWARVISSIDRYERRGKFRSWLFSCAHNILVDHYRKRSPEILPETQGLVAPAEELDSNLELRVHQLMKSLPFDQRQAFYLREMLGCSMKEISSIQNCSLEATRSRLRYAYNKLKRKLLAEQISSHDQNNQRSTGKQPVMGAEN